METERQFEVENSSNYTEIGIIPDEGKHLNIRMLENILDLNIPSTIVVGKNPTDEDKEIYDKWLEKNKDKDILLRTDRSFGRNSYSNRDPNNPKTLWEDMKNLEGLKTIILQALPENTINKDIVSANIFFYKDPHFPSKIKLFSCEINPDIATIINRTNLTPFFKGTFKNGSLEITDNESRKLTWNMIRYRVGRDHAKKEKLRKYPKLEEINTDDPVFQKIVNLGQRAIEEKPEEYPAPAYWNPLIKEKGLKKVQLPEDIRKELEKEMRKINLNRLPHRSGIFKMSVIMGEDDQLEPIYWDLIYNKENDIIHYEH